MSLICVRAFLGPHRSVTMTKRPPPPPPVRTTNDRIHVERRTNTHTDCNSCAHFTVWYRRWFMALWMHDDWRWEVEAVGLIVNLGIRIACRVQLQFRCTVHRYFAVHSVGTRDCKIGSTKETNYSWKWLQFIRFKSNMHRFVREFVAIKSATVLAKKTWTANVCTFLLGQVLLWFSSDVSSQLFDRCIHQIDRWSWSTWRVLNYIRHSDGEYFTIIQKYKIYQFFWNVSSAFASL